MRGVALALVALGSGGCTDPAIEMHLKLPTSTQANTFDVSCVSAIRVDVQGNDQGDENHDSDTISKCIDLATPPKSFSDIQRAMSGQFALGLPKSGLAGVALRGSVGTCNNDLNGGDHESVFYGGAVHSGDSITIPVVPGVSCDKTKTYKVRPIDLIALSTTKTCTAPTDTPLVQAGDFRPLMLGDDFPHVVIDWGTSYAEPAAGVATVESYSATAGSDSCVALLYDGATAGGAGCVNASAPTLCGLTGELELPTIPYNVAGNSIDADLLKQYGPVVFGEVFEVGTAATKVPLVGATVELEDPSQGTVVYVQRGMNRLDPISGARATMGDAMFMVYLKGGPTGLLVKAANHTPQRVVVATTGDMPTTVIAALVHM